MKATGKQTHTDYNGQTNDLEGQIQDVHSMLLTVSTTLFKIVNLSCVHSHTHQTLLRMNTGDIELIEKHLPERYIISFKP